MKKLRLACPHCGHSIDFPETQIGQTIHCPSCALKVGFQPPKAKAKVKLGAEAEKVRDWQTEPASTAGGTFHPLIAAAAGVIMVGLIIVITRAIIADKSTRSNSSSILASRAGTIIGSSAEQMEKTAYLTNLTVSAFSVQRNDFEGVWEATATFRLWNKGDRPVTGVSVQISLMDTNSNVVLEQTVVPFSGRTNDPLMPGRSWQNDEANAFLIPGIPDDWKSGNDFLKITDVELLK